MQTDKEARKKNCRSLFAYLGKNPRTWWLSSNRLKEAADVLRDSCWPKKKKRHDQEAATADFRLGPVYMLLTGLAVEDALKAILVAENPHLVEEQRISTDLATHDLRDLWGRAGLPRCRQHDQLLDCLKSFVTFARYPVSKTKQSMGTMIEASFQEESDFAAVTRLWASMERHMKKSIPGLIEETENADAS